MQWVNTATDAVGCGIDDGIRDLIIALNAVGVQTLASCEGHLEHGLAAPWVDVGTPAARPLAKEAYRKLQSVEQARAHNASLEERHALRESADQAQMAVKQLHMAERLKLMGYLDQFYTHRRIPFDVHLILNHLEWTGIIRLESQGANCQDCLPSDERARKLVAYREEMQAFAAFLKAQFFTTEEQTGEL